jgi:hypothetical protein
MIWTVDAQKARKFLASYEPKIDILLVQINWNGIGGFHLISNITQKRILKAMGRENYIKLPKEGTNPRGVEISKEALLKLVNAPETKTIEIEWQRSAINYLPYERWLDYWEGKQQIDASKRVQTKIT